MEEKYIFKFEKYPYLLEVFKEYRRLRLIAVEYSMTDSKENEEKYQKADEKFKYYAYEILAMKIFETFNKEKPKLYSDTKEKKKFSWDEVFGDSFDNLDIKLKKCLVGLLKGNFVYRLPPKYYNK